MKYQYEIHMVIVVKWNVGPNGYATVYSINRK